MNSASDFKRESQLERLTGDDRPWDIVVIGGGATGVGIAVDAAARGYRVALLEAHDFGKGTSSRSTKLVHGGVRYLQQFRFHLVHEALRERGLLHHNAPHLVHPLPTIVPLHSRWEGVYYGFGLKVYEWMSGKWSLGPSRRLSVEEAVTAIPTLERRGLCGGVRYLDGAFDDARLLVNLVQTAIEHGGVCVNYAPVRELVREAGKIRGVVAEDTEAGRELRLAARVVVNATGPFSDAVRHLDEPAAEKVIAPSQGVHLVFDREFMPCETALIVPKTPDGRVIFAIPWHQHTVVGTTDTPLDATPTEPRALPAEIDFLLETIAPYLSPAPQRSDIRAVFAGIRPLVRSASTSKTSQLGRDHEVRVSDSQLVSVLGGKWTTYRRMAEDAVTRAAAVAGLPARDCATTTMPIHGSSDEAAGGVFKDYGSDGPAVEQLAASTPGWNEPLDSRLPFVAGQVVWAARNEMARTLEDVLGRRLRALFLNAEAAVASAPRVAELLAAELQRDAAWQADQIEKFRQIADAYRPASYR
jgi:glycerol-3-phosphate dehydrogenase